MNKLINKKELELEIKKSEENLRKLKIKSHFFCNKIAENNNDILFESFYLEYLKKLEKKQ